MKPSDGDRWELQLRAPMPTVLGWSDPPLVIAFKSGLKTADADDAHTTLGSPS
jgi:hypothetical protein